jgi:hypothetical protein
MEEPLLCLLSSFWRNPRDAKLSWGSFPPAEALVVSALQNGRRNLIPQRIFLWGSDRVRLGALFAPCRPVRPSVPPLQQTFFPEFASVLGSNHVH